MLKVVLEDETLSQSTTCNGANISQVFENCGKMSTVLTAHSLLLMINQHSQYLGAFRLMVSSTRNDRKCKNICSIMFSILTKNVEMQRVSTPVIPQFPTVEQTVNQLNTGTGLMLLILCLILICDYLPRSSATR